MLRKPETKADYSGVNFESHNRTAIENAKPLSELNKQIEKQTKEQYIWVKEGKKRTRKKIEIENN